MEYFSTYDFAITLLDSYLIAVRGATVNSLSRVCKLWKQRITSKEFKDKILHLLAKPYKDRNITCISTSNGQILHGHRFNIIFEYGKIVDITARVEKYEIGIDSTFLYLYFSPYINFVVEAHLTYELIFSGRNKHYLPKYIQYSVKDYGCRGTIYYIFNLQKELVAIREGKIYYHLKGDRWYIDNNPHRYTVVHQKNVEIDTKLFYHWFGIRDYKIIDIPSLVDS